MDASDLEELYDLLLEEIERELELYGVVFGEKVA